MTRPSWKKTRKNYSRVTAVLKESTDFCHTCLHSCPSLFPPEYAARKWRTKVSLVLINQPRVAEEVKDGLLLRLRLRKGRIHGMRAALRLLRALLRRVGRGK